MGINEHMRYRESTDMKRLKGSLTLEASLVLPIFLFAMLTLLSIVAVIPMYLYIEEAVGETALYTCEHEEVLHGDFAGNVNDIFTEHLEKCVDYEIQDGVSGIRTDNSRLLQSSYVLVSAQYTPKMKTDLLHLFSYPIGQQALVHTWDGYSGDLSDTEEMFDEQMVYVSENREVYHLTTDCTYLSLTVYQTNGKEVGKLRNASGGKYKACRLCHPKKKSDVLFITREGDRYHCERDCSGLKRSVSEIPLSEALAEGLHPCTRCGH